jgi:hypothetical protein
MVTLIANFAGLVLFCTLVMVMDFLVKRAKYSRWKVRLHMLCEDDFYNRRCFCVQASPGSGYSTPAHKGEQGTVYHSLSTISEYIPLTCTTDSADIQVIQSIKNFPHVLNV